MLYHTKMFPENPNETFQCMFTAWAGPCVVRGNTQPKPGLETSLLEGRVLFSLLSDPFLSPVSIGAFATFMHGLLAKILVFKYDCCRNYFAIT